MAQLIDRDGAVARYGSQFAPTPALIETRRGARPFILGVALALSAYLPAFATVAPVSSATANPQITLVAQGCGPGWYRGPNGACHRFGHGPGPSWLYHGGGPGAGRALGARGIAVEVTEGNRDAAVISLASIAGSGRSAQRRRTLRLGKGVFRRKEAAVRNCR
jgi:hypothetical protein